VNSVIAGLPGLACSKDSYVNFCCCAQCCDCHQRRW